MGCCLKWSCRRFSKQFSKTQCGQGQQYLSCTLGIWKSFIGGLTIKHINQINRKVSLDSFQLIAIKYHSLKIHINHISFCMSKQTQERREGGLSKAGWHVCFLLMLYLKLEVLQEKENTFFAKSALYWLFRPGVFCPSRGPTCCLASSIFISCFCSLPVTTGSTVFLNMRDSNSTWING